MLIPSQYSGTGVVNTSLSRRVNANSQPYGNVYSLASKLIKKGEC